MRHTKVLAGSSNPAFADQVVKHIGMPIGKTQLGKFSNMETSVMVRPALSLAGLQWCSSRRR
mgnify:CR=1 FL=1